jgi:hypothetical protein
MYHPKVVHQSTMDEFRQSKVTESGEKFNQGCENADDSWLFRRKKCAVPETNIQYQESKSIVTQIEMYFFMVANQKTKIKMYFLF